MGTRSAPLALAGPAQPRHSNGAQGENYSSRIARGVCKRFQDGRRAHLAGLAATMTRSINSTPSQGPAISPALQEPWGAGVPLEPDRNPHVWVAIAGPPGGPTFCNVHPEICRPARSMTVTRRVALVQQWSSWAVFPGHRRLA